MAELSNRSVKTLRRMVQDWKQSRAEHAGRTGTTGGNIGAARRFRIISVAANYLTCKATDGTTDRDGLVYVAKPFTLRVLGWDGATRNGKTYSNYSADGQSRQSYQASDASTEPQIVIPEYMPAGGDWPGDEIYATPANTGIPGPDGQTITLVDLNADGRAWAWDEEAD